MVKHTVGQFIIKEMLSIKYSPNSVKPHLIFIIYFHFTDRWLRIIWQGSSNIVIQYANSTNKRWKVSMKNIKTCLANVLNINDS